MAELSSQYIEVNNLRIHYTEAGSGPPVLLIHGFPTSSHLWRNVMPELAKTHRAIAIDLPGYGLSDKPLDVKYDFAFYEEVLEGFLDTLDIHDTDLAVHDLGGPIGLFWAVRHPRRVKQLVLLNTLVYPETSWAVKLALLALRTPGVRDYLVSPKGIVAAMKLGVVHKDRLTREALTPYTAPFEDAPARQALIKAGSGLGTKDLAEIARKLPTLEVSLRIIYGENDRALPDVAKTMQRVKQAHPLAEVTPLPNCGHFLQEDDPERVGQLMAEFLNRANPITPTQQPAADQATGVPEDRTPRISPIPNDLTPAQQPAADLVRAFNDWAQNDLDIAPAAVTHCSRQSLPDDPRELMRLIPEAHRTFFDQAAGPDFQTLDFTPARTTEGFDPTADILPPPEDSPAGQQAQSKPTAYFNSRPITLIQATGTDTAADLTITLLIALDPQSSQLFTFITALSD
jgi:haloalkane dehalogenase